MGDLRAGERRSGPLPQERHLRKVAPASSRQPPGRRRSPRLHRGTHVSGKGAPPCARTDDLRIFAEMDSCSSVPIDVRRSFPGADNEDSGDLRRVSFRSVSPPAAPDHSGGNLPGRESRPGLTAIRCCVSTGPANKKTGSKCKGCLTRCLKHVLGRKLCLGVLVVRVFSYHKDTKAQRADLDFRHRQRRIIHPKT